MPTRRGWSFGLSTLFILVTLGCVAAWYLQRPTYQVYGNLSRGDVAAICKVIATSPQVTDRRILVIEERGGPGEVEVMTGEQKAPRNGQGQLVRLKNQNGVWSVLNVVGWAS